MRISEKFDPDSTKRSSILFVYLDIEVRGLEDFGLTHIGDDGLLVSNSTVLGYSPSRVQVAIRPLVSGGAQIAAIDMVLDAPSGESSYDESRGYAERMSNVWYAQELTFSHYEKRSFMRRVPVFTATAARELVPTAGVKRWFLNIGDVVGVTPPKRLVAA